MKKIQAAAIFMTALLLSACGASASVSSQAEPATSGAASEAAIETPTPQPEPEAEPIFADVSELPGIDGSTACMPLIARTIADTCGLPLDEAENYVHTNKTAGSWVNLIEGYTDIIFAYEMPESVAEEYGSQTELKVCPIGRDALVFMVNELNPVQNLTRQQLRDIYTGKITNWKDVGGNDEPITAFQRDESSGSQTLFMKLLMEGETPAEAPTELRPGMMDMLVKSLARYNNEGTAIGYSVYYYIHEMYSQPGLRLLSVDGVEPGFETLQSGEYPMINEFYAAVRGDEPEDSAAGKMFAWIQSEAGEKAIEQSGYVPAGKRQ